MDALKLYEDALDDLASDLITEDEFTKIIKCLRDVQEVKHGHWVENKSSYFVNEDGTREYDHNCSVCGYGNTYNKMGEPLYLQYCSHCGAKMDEEVDNGEQFKSKVKET